MTLLDSTTTTAIYDIDDTPAPSKRPSARAIRQERQELEYCLLSLEAVSASKTKLELEARLRESVFGSGSFTRLARYRQQYVLGYTRGASDALAKKAGRPISIIPPPDDRVPAKVRLRQPGATWHKHPHGGGWVSHTAYAALTAYAGPNAVIYDEGRLLDTSRLYGEASICETGEVCEGSQVHGTTIVAGTTVVKEGAVVFGDELLLEGVITGRRTPATTMRPPMFSALHNEMAL